MKLFLQGKFQCCISVSLIFLTVKGRKPEAGFGCQKRKEKGKEKEEKGRTAKKTRRN